MRSDTSFPHPSSLVPHPWSEAMADFWLREATAAFEDVLRREAEEGRPAARERLQVLRDSYLALRAASLDRQVARTKGAWVLWMLRQAVGPLSFRTIWTGLDGPPTTTEALKETLSAVGG